MIDHPLRAVLGMLAVAGEAAIAQGPPEPRTLGPGLEVTPTRVARVGMADGRVVFRSDWMPYAPAEGPSRAVRIFDCYGDIDSDAVPDDSGACGLGTNRWYFGSGYCLGSFVNDMTVAPDTLLDAGASRCDLAWFWTAGGPGTSERCIIAVFTQDSEPCDPNSFDNEGWLIDLGALPSSLGGGGYYRTSADLGPGAWPLPADGAGSYAVAFLQEVTSSGAWVCATCAQPMLWGTGDAGGAQDMVGAQGPLELDGDCDFSYTQTACYSYSFSGLCPSVLGGMAQFWGVRTDFCLGMFPNCNGDSELNTQDYLCYLTKWSDAVNGQTYDPEADCNLDGRIDTHDFVCYLRKFAACF